MAPYADLRALYAAMPAGALVAPLRTVEAVDVGLSTFRLRGHGLSTNDLLTFEPRGNGAVLPPPLSAAAPYYAIRVTADLFQVAASKDGAAVTLSGPPVGLMSMVIDLEQTIETTLEWRSRHIDQHLPAHATPFQRPIHPLVVQWTVVLSRYDLAVAQGLLSPQYKDSADPWSAAADRVQKKLDNFSTGEALQGAPLKESASGSNNDAVAWEDTEAPDWNRTGRGILG